MSAEPNAWDAWPEVRSPAGRFIDDLLEEGPPRQPLPGFDPVYRDVVDYILRCTHRIWEEKDAGLCRTHYSAGCVVHTAAGETVGAETVAANTVAALSVTSDRRLIAEDVIWSDDGDGLLHSSHRIVSRATHAGDDGLLGPATGRECGVMTIADCAVRENRIVEEWLVRDNARAVRLVGREPPAVAAMLAEADRVGDADRHLWRSRWIAQTRNGTDAAIPEQHPAAACVRLLALAFRGDLFGEAAALLSPMVEVRWPSGRRGWGRGYWIGCVGQLCAALGSRAFRIEHAAARPLPEGEVAVALRWALTGRHGNGGAWGEATERELLVPGISHFRLRAGRVVEDATVFDELAVLRQVAGGLGA